MPKTTYLARVSVVSAEEEEGRRVFIVGSGLFNGMEWNEMKWNRIIM
jgi:hypothetical protein